MADVAQRWPAAVRSYILRKSCNQLLQVHGWARPIISWGREKKEKKVLQQFFL
jgi:hypothetical protein